MKVQSYARLLVLNGLLAGLMVCATIHTGCGGSGTDAVADPAAQESAGTDTDDDSATATDGTTDTSTSTTTDDGTTTGDSTATGDATTDTTVAADAEVASAFSTDGTLTDAAQVVVESCATTCGSDTACLTTCLAAGGISADDSTCIAAGASCSADKCNLECAAGLDDPTCQACFEANCSDATADSCAASDAVAGDTAAETDTDGDTILDDSDNCPSDANTDQADADSDGTGDVCESADAGAGSTAGACEVTDETIFQTCSSNASFGSCVQTAAAIPVGCAACYDGIMTCVGTSCATECADQSSAACTTCRDTNCTPAFETCAAGVTP